MKQISLIIIAFAWAGIIKAQVLKNYDRTYGSNGVDRPVDIFYKAGKTFVFGNITKPTISIGNITAANGSVDYNLVIYDNTGAKITDICYGGDREDRLLKVFDFDSLFVMVGVSKSDNGSGTKNSDNSVLDNDASCPVNGSTGTAIGDGFYEIYLISVDHSGNIKKETSVVITEACYASTYPGDLESIYAAHNSTVDVYSACGANLLYSEFHSLVNVLGIAVDNTGTIRITTSELSRLQSDPKNYLVTEAHVSGPGGPSSCTTTYSTQTGSFDILLGCQVSEYSITGDLSQISKDKESFCDFVRFPGAHLTYTPCPNGCSHQHQFVTDNNNSYSQQALMDFFTLEGYNDVMDGSWDMNIGDGGRELLPQAYSAFYLNGQWVLATKEQYVYYDSNSGLDKAWPGKFNYRLGFSSIFGNQNNYLSRPVDVKSFNSKYYIFIDDFPNVSPYFNSSTPPPSGIYGPTPPPFVRNLSSLPNTGIYNNTETWIVEATGTPSVITSLCTTFTCTSAGQTIIESDYCNYNTNLPLTLTRQNTVRANQTFTLNSVSEVFDTNKVFLNYSTQAGVGYNKHTANKGQLDYWLVKFNLKTMQVMWDTAFGGPQSDELTCANMTSGALVLSGFSKSSIGGNKTQGSYDSNYGDYWTLNYCFPPSADFTANQQVLTPGDYVNFTNASSGAGVFSWDFSDNVPSFDKNPVHYFYNPGYYTVKLTAGNGVCQATKVKTNYILVGNYTGIDEMDKPVDGGIYPNPCYGEFFFITGGGFIVQVTNVMGETVKFSQSGNRVELQNQREGCYFVTYKIEERFYTTKLMID